ncbi:hypothetical protein ONS95_005293 [Cadophora gregata]|uniref:uncharacterized protein n=1 Tax=Cadophora gregata TaxID=51156 RepID=UPI0026DD849C|nr:uncharacterized protein ONS95_005293 [Cadophora gregata]KAK0103259.1 hypothetical protein ONS95_005293 [Cadophora gregata]
MMTATRMPGNWPIENRQEVSVRGGLRLNTDFSQGLLQVPTMASASPSSSNSRDELFFECRPIAASTDSSEEALASYLAFEPVVESVANDEHIDWRRYEPPRELLESQEGTSPTLRDLLPVSIERLRARHEEEEERRAASARRERPIARVGRASVKPRRDRESLNSSQSLDPGFLSAEPSRLSGASATSISSTDSGYTSMVIEPDPRPEPIARLKRASKKPFGLASLFRRTFDFDGLSESSAPSPPDTTQIPEPTRPAPTVQPPPLECVSCLDDFDASHMITLSCHSYCTECFQRLVSTALESETHWPAKCCLNPIPSENIFPHLDSATKTKYQQRDAEWSIPTSDRVYCTHTNCGTWIPPKQVNAGAARNFAKCPKCSKRTCTLCRGPYHNGNDCPQDPALQATANLAEMEGWKRCYSCHAYVEHNKGCRHMTCRCKAQFCYICGERWKTCSCTDEQLHTIQAQVASRREEAAAQTQRSAAENARRAAEEEELRQILQEIDDFERAEEERLAAELEAARIREEAEERLRAEERRRAEDERLAVVNRRFRQLGVELEILTDVQRVLMAERYEFEVEVLKKEKQDALDTLSIRHPAEMNTLAMESQRRIAESESKFEQEYQLRLDEERRIEDDYVTQLRAFYSGKPEAEYRVREARDELRENQAKEYRFWDAYRRKQLVAVREGESRKVEALRVKQESERRAVEGRASIDRVEWQRRVWAEGQWVDAVTAERGAMLMAMEQEDYAGGS